MGMNFDIDSYIILLKTIKKRYTLLKNDSKNSLLYQDLKNSLEELKVLIDDGKIPSHLIYKTEVVYYNFYRLMEGCYIREEKRKK